MSRFGTDMDFFYQTNGSNWIAGTQIQLSAGQLPQYPFEEYRISDTTVLRNLNGNAWTYQNYNKAGYRFKWTYMDETAALSLKRMFDAKPYITFYSNGTNFGTFVMNGDPSMSEVQFELYDIELDLQEN